MVYGAYFVHIMHPCVDTRRPPPYNAGVTRERPGTTDLRTGAIATDTVLAGAVAKRLARPRLGSGTAGERLSGKRGARLTATRAPNQPWPPSQGWPYLTWCSTLSPLGMDRTPIGIPAPGHPAPSTHTRSVNVVGRAVGRVTTGRMTHIRCPVGAGGGQNTRVAWLPRQGKEGGTGRSPFHAR